MGRVQGAGHEVYVYVCLVVPTRHIEVGRVSRSEYDEHVHGGFIVQHRHIELGRVESDHNGMYVFRRVRIQAATLRGRLGSLTGKQEENVWKFVCKNAKEGMHVSLSSQKSRNTSANT